MRNLDQSVFCRGKGALSLSCFLSEKSQSACFIFSDNTHAPDF